MVDVQKDIGPPPAERLPAAWGDYDLLAVLGSGGNGIVYHARRRDSGAEVAYKTFAYAAPPTEEALLRFQREASTGAALDHPGIVPVVDFGKVGKLPYLAMPYVHGCNLQQALAAGRFPGRADRVRLLVEVARALGHAHAHRIIHRDVKPSNILIGDDGRPRLTDFGLAKSLDQSQPLTAPGQMIGTLRYMPPEQIEGEVDRIGPSCDVYALGVVLYELLVDLPPFSGATFAALATQVLTKDPPAPRSIDPSVPAGLEAICLRALSRDPAMRPATATALADELEGHLAGRPPLAAPAPPAPAAKKPWWKRIV